MSSSSLRFKLNPFFVHSGTNITRHNRHRPSTTIPSQLISQNQHLATNPRPIRTVANMTFRKDAVVTTKDAPGPFPVVSQAIVANNIVYVSGNVGMKPGSDKLEVGVAAQTTQVIRNLDASLKAAGSDLSKVFKCNVFITDMAKYAEMNEAYLVAFEAPHPVRTCVQVAGLPLGAEVEIECQAIINESAKL